MEMNPLPQIPWLEDDKSSQITERKLRAAPGTSARQVDSPTNNLSLPMIRERRINLYRISWLRPLLESLWPQFLVRALTLAGFVFAILAGLFGTVVGSHNFAIIFVWIAWWSVFKLVFIPLGGRTWCSICPIPLPGEWMQQGGILRKNRRSFGLNRRWPRRLKGAWLQSGAFLLIGLFGALTITDARVTGWVFVALFGLAFGLSLIFERRAFCSYLCPIGGFSSLYAQMAPVEVRAIDTGICSRHGEKSCYQACPWGLYPVAFRDSRACGLCMECLRACPKDNLALNLRPFGSDIGGTRSIKRLDKAFLALVMLGSALAFTAVFVGPWGWLKSAAFEIGSTHWLAYAAGFLFLNLLVLPALFALAVWGGQRLGERLPGNTISKSQTLRREIANQSQALLPVGLMAWIAFTVSFALPKLGLVLGVLNDPLGWGWNLLGAAYTPWAPDVTAFSLIFQVIFLLIGLLWAVNVARRLAGANLLQSVPVLAFCFSFSLGMLWLLIG